MLPATNRIHWPRSARLQTHTRWHRPQPWRHQIISRATDRCQFSTIVKEQLPRIELVEELARFLAIHCGAEELLGIVTGRNP